MPVDAKLYMALVHKKEAGKQTSGQNIKGENRFETGMHRRASKQ